MAIGPVEADFCGCCHANLTIVSQIREVYSALKIKKSVWGKLMSGYRFAVGEGASSRATDYVGPLPSEGASFQAAARPDSRAGGMAVKPPLSGMALHGKAPDDKLSPAINRPSPMGLPVPGRQASGPIAATPVSPPSDNRTFPVKGDDGAVIARLTRDELQQFQKDLERPLPESFKRNFVKKLIEAEARKGKIIDSQKCYDHCSKTGLFDQIRDRVVTQKHLHKERKNYDRIFNGRPAQSPPKPFQYPAWRSISPGLAEASQVALARDFSWRPPSYRAPTGRRNDSPALTGMAVGHTVDIADATAPFEVALSNLPPIRIPASDQSTSSSGFETRSTPSTRSMGSPETQSPIEHQDIEIVEQLLRALVV